MAYRALAVIQLETTPEIGLIELVPWIDSRIKRRPGSPAGDELRFRASP